MLRKLRETGDLHDTSHVSGSKQRHGGSAQNHRDSYQNKHGHRISSVAWHQWLTQVVLVDRREAADPLGIGNYTMEHVHQHAD